MSKLRKTIEEFKQMIKTMTDDDLKLLTSIVINEVSGRMAKRLEEK